MNRFKALSVSTALLLLGSIGLSACGGDPTATPVPPTATPRPAATATTPAPVSRVATDDEVSSINAALASAKRLESYHFDIEVKPSTFITQEVKAQGDYEAPDLVYVKGTMGKQSFENIVVGDVAFTKNSSGEYVKIEKTQSTGDPLESFTPDSFISSGNPLAEIDEFSEAIAEYEYVGDLQVDGVRVKHFTFKLDLEKMTEGQGMGDMDLSGLDLGGGGFYVDDNNKVLYGVEYNLNVAAFIELIARAFSSFGGTPTPGGAKPTPLPRLDVNMIMKVTDHNNPSIKVPVTDEMRAQAEEKPTEEPFEFPTEEPFELPTVSRVDTPEVDATPEADSTVEADATPEAFPTFAGLPEGDGQVHEGKVGEPIEAGWARFTLDSVERNAKGIIDPPTGKEYIILNVTVENVSSDEEQLVSSFLNMSLTDSSGNKLDQTFTANYTKQLDGEDTELSKGESVSGEVAYEVPAGAKNLTLDFLPYVFFDEDTIIRVVINE